MKISKKVMGVAMSMAMLGSQVMPALASSTPTTTTGGTANILDYQVETVVVPTTLKITLNPKGYAVTKYVKAMTFAADTVYYTESSGTYSEATTQPTAATFVPGIYYTATTSTDQVVSLNYGVANKSTGAKNVKVDFAATYTATADKTAIQFVDSAKKAQAYDASTNADGAKTGELKMYLAVASASAVPTANTYVKTLDTTVGSNKTYFAKNGSAYTKVDAPSDDDIGTYYEITTTIGTEITAAELSDVTMTAATAGNQAFATGTTNKADASIAYSLEEATYGLKEGENIDFGTSQDELESKLEMTAIGGVAGFTLTGAINADANWTEADAKSITITPTYTITDATGSEAAVSGTHNQVELNAGPSATANISTLSPDTDVVMTYNLGLGDDAATSVSSVTVKTSTGSDGTLSGTAFCTIDASAKTVTISKAYAQALVDGGMTGATYTIVFDNNKTASCVVGTMN